jgi:hypothetical protein
MYTGGCLCGKVRYQISAKLEDMVYCHCSLCRKAQGSAFASNANIDKKHFQFTAGEDQLTAYEALPGHHKYFCKHCGSPIISSNVAHPDKFRVRVGTIETDINERPVAHIYASSKANWENICDDLPQFDSYIEE